MTKQVGRPVPDRVNDRIARIRVATILHHLADPIHFGSWVMRHREFALVRIDSEAGLSGFAYCLTRDGPLAEIVRRTIAPAYVGGPIHDPAAAFRAALWSNNAVHAAGIGMRALSVVDIAAWDLAARAEGQTMAEYLGGERRRMPVTGIVGYPPSIGPDETVAQIRALWEAGWRRFKLPIAPTPDASIARLQAAREAFPEAWLGIDNNFYSKTAADAIAFGRRLDGLSIGWFEDVVPPGDAAMVAEIRKGISTPVAMGDEQGGSYHPQALLAFDAVDVLRVDATTNGGITRLRGIVESATRCGDGRRAAHVPARPQPGPGCARPRRPDRVGRSRHRRSPDGRQPGPTGRPRRPDGPAAGRARPRATRRPGVDRDAGHLGP